MQTKQKAKCEICGRELSDPESIALRVGPECQAKQQLALASITAARNTLTAAREDNYMARQLKGALRHYDLLQGIAEQQRRRRPSIEDALRRDLLRTTARIAALKPLVKPHLKQEAA